MSFRQLLLLTGLCANAFQGSPEPCKSFQVFMFLLKRYPAALILKKKKRETDHFFLYKSCVLELFFFMTGGKCEWLQQLERLRSRVFQARRAALL